MHATHLLRGLGSQLTPSTGLDPVAAWAGSGAMALTGLSDGPPLCVTGPTVALEGALLALHALAPGRVLPDVRLLGERAACADLTRRGTTSCGGRSKLLPAADGWVAVALARDEDYDLVPALVEDEIEPGKEWESLTAYVARSLAHDASVRARLLGLPLTVLGEQPACDTPWILTAKGAAREMPARPRVLDLSALWAGPLCASLLRLLGCDVLKVEDPRRPDGARGGDPRFFDLLHEGASSIAIDLSSGRGRRRLRDLVDAADVVIENSRPRALEHLGLLAHEVVAQGGATWVSITAHGRDQPDRVGYGDDAAVAAGLVAWTAQTPVFVSDAVSDPLAGVYAALAAWAGLLGGGGVLIDVSLARSAAVAASLSAISVDAVLLDGRWCVPTPGGHVRVAEPWARSARGHAPMLQEQA